MISRLMAVVLAGAMLTGCATVIRGTTTKFVVRSIPEGAQVTLSTGETCAATPCTFTRPRKEQFTVSVKKDGFEPVEASIRSYWSKNGTVTGVVGNAIIGGGIGIGVDAATGANRDLEPNPLLVELKLLPAVAAAPVVEPSSTTEAEAPTPPSAPEASEPAPSPTPAPVTPPVTSPPG